MSAFSTLPARTEGIRPGCVNGTRYTDQAKAERLNPGAEVYGCWLCPGWHAKAVPHVGCPRPVAATGTRDTGFSAAVKLDTRKRAGLGDIDAAVCEACAIWLGRYGGQVQHIVARMMGGRGPKAPWWMWTVVDAALLCGTPETGDHGLCESRDAAMGPDGFGFWLPSTASPFAAPMTLYGRRPGRGIEVWRTADGKYSDTAPVTAGVA